MLKLCALVCLALSLQVNAQNLNIDSLKRLLPSAPPDTNRVILYRMLAGLVKNQDPVAAASYARQGVALGHELSYDKGLAGCYLNLAAAYISLGKLDSALQFQDTAITVSHKVGEPNRLALAYLNRADIYMQLRLFEEALRDCDTSLHYADIANSDDRRGRVYQTFGSIHYHQEQYDKAIPYYEKAYQLYMQAGNKQMSSIALNNAGNAYKHTGNHAEAMKRFQQLITQADSTRDQVNMSMYYGNISDLYLEMNQLLLAEKYGADALRYARQTGIGRPLVHANMSMASIRLRRNDLASAITFARTAWDGSKRLEDLALQQSSASLLAEIYAKQQDHRNAYEFLEIAGRLKDTLNKQQFTQDIAGMQTRFEVEEKDKEIQLLAKDRALKDQQLRAQQGLLIGSIILIALGIASVVLLINRYRLRRRMEELELRNRIAADLHDEVGSSLSSIHLLSQMANTPATQDAVRTSIISKMSINAQETMEKMSDIVWMIKPEENDQASLESRMRKFLFDIAESKSIECNFTAHDLERLKLSMVERRQVYLLFKEAVNNAVKYSGSKTIDVLFGQEQGMVKLIVADKGAGFDVSRKSSGNGLRNMQKRAEELGGKFICDTKSGEGTTIALTFPAKLT